MAVEAKYQTFWARFLAGIIDGIVFIPITFLDNFLLSYLESPSLLSVWIVISYSLYFLYSIGFHWLTGQTLGKRAMGIKVMDLSETRTLTLKQAFLRDSVYVVLQFIGVFLIVRSVLNIGFYSPFEVSDAESMLSLLSFLWFLLEIITMFSNSKRRAFHDLMAGSVVVDMDEE